MAGGAFQLHFATQRLDVAADHVHAHAATGQVGDRFGGGEAGLEDQVPDLRVGGVLGYGQATLGGLGEDAFAIQAAAVVADFDDDVAALVRSRQGDGAGLVLARLRAHVGHFQAMVDRVADQVHQRIGDAFDQALVQLRAFADGAQAHLLAQARGQVADQAREAAEHGIHRQHAHANDGFLQVAGVALQQVQAGEQAFALGLVEHAGDLLQHGLGDDQFADQVDQAVDLVDADADGGFGGIVGRRRGGRGRRLRAAGDHRRRGLRGHGDGVDRHGVALHGLDVQLAVVDHPGEHIVHRAARHLADQAQVPGQVGFQRIDLLEAGQAFHAARDVQRAQVFQFAQDAQRIVAAHEQRRCGREADLPAFRRVVGLRGRGGRRSGGRFLAGQHRVEAVLDGLHGGGIGRRAVFGFGQQGAQHIDRGQHGVDRGRADGALAGAQFVQQRLQHMGQAGDGIEAERGRPALDRVGRAEDRVDQVAVAASLFQRQQPGFHRLQPFTAFFEERGVEALHVHVHGDDALVRS